MVGCGVGTFVERTNQYWVGLSAVQTEFLADRGCRVVCIQRYDELPEELT